MSLNRLNLEIPKIKIDPEIDLSQYKFSTALVFEKFSLPVFQNPIPLSLLVPPSREEDLMSQVIRSQESKVKNAVPMPTPKIYKNSHEENTYKNRVGGIADVIWLKLYGYLDATSAVQTLLACKHLALIANHLSVRTHLRAGHQSQEVRNHRRNQIQRRDLVTEKSLFKMIKMPEKEIYNPGPQGFVLR
jgi:hypothetical protein